MKHYEQPLQKFKTSSLFPILGAEKLLAGPEHLKVLRKLHTLVMLSDDHYEVLYRGLVHNFAEFVQVLPLGESGHVASVLNEGLEHALVSMQLLFDSGITKSNQLLTYAVFSAALMQDIGKVVVNRKIMISDSKGAFIHEWSPHGQPMPQSVGSHFKIRYTQDAPLRMSSRVTPLFARQLMPESGYSWIVSNPEILTMWLAALGDTTDDDSALVGIYLGMALRKLKAEKPYHLPEIPVEILEPLATKAGEAFWEWLQQGLISGAIGVNVPGSGVELATDGLLLGEGVFRNFQKNVIKTGNWMATRTQFNHLGLTEQSSQNGKNAIIRQYLGAPITGATASFAANNNQLSYLAKQFHNLTTDTHPAAAVGSGKQRPLPQAERSVEAIMIAARFLPALPAAISPQPEPTTAELYFQRAIELELRSRPPLFQPEKKQ